MRKATGNHLISKNEAKIGVSMINDQNIFFANENKISKCLSLNQLLQVVNFDLIRRAGPGIGDLGSRLGRHAGCRGCQI